MNTNSNNSLITKYNVDGPRYTSYPTVPYWNENDFNIDDWKYSLQKSFSESNAKEGISLYIHLPFCESMCTFCGCNKRITKNHKVETPYIDSLLKEWQLYLDLFNEKPIIRQIHLGGGTPTFFESKNLERLIKGVFKDAERTPSYEFSFEGHPNNTTIEQLQTLANMGFNRVSYGVQDYSETVQKAINRIQPFENVKRVTDDAKKLGYHSIGHDIIFGLPFQTVEDVVDTINKTIEINPGRIAFYSYAHVPWIKGLGQRGFKDKDLPKAEIKRIQYEKGKELLTNAGYVEIGMDHFALKTDSLYQAQEEQTIHRNFMGYTDNKTQLMIGLGVSSIGDTWYAFSQNVKDLDDYQSLVSKGEFPVFRGHLLTEEDLLIRRHILNLMCHFETSWESKHMKIESIEAILDQLREIEKDQLLKINENSIKVTYLGRAFIRNICMAFDLRLQRKKPETQLFSKTI